MECSVCGKKRVFVKAQEEGWCICPFVKEDKHASLAFCSVACANKYQKKMEAAFEKSGYEEERRTIMITTTKLEVKQ